MRRITRAPPEKLIPWISSRWKPPVSDPAPDSIFRGTGGGDDGLHMDNLISKKIKEGRMVIGGGCRKNRRGRGWPAKATVLPAGQAGPLAPTSAPLPADLALAAHPQLHVKSHVHAPFTLDHQNASP